MFQLSSVLVICEPLTERHPVTQAPPQWSSALGSTRRRHLPTLRTWVLSSSQRLSYPIIHIISQRLSAGQMSLSYLSLYRGPSENGLSTSCLSFFHSALISYICRSKWGKCGGEVWYSRMPVHLPRCAKRLSQSSSLLLTGSVCYLSCCRGGRCCIGFCSCRRASTWNHSVTGSMFFSRTPHISP